MAKVKQLGDYIKLPDILSGIYKNIELANERPAGKHCLPILPHHFKELTEGSGLHLSTLARTGVRSVSDPEHIYHILSRHDKIDPADHKAKRSTLSMSRDGKPILVFLNPLMPDEAHSKKDGFTYMAARGSCKPPLIWAPQAQVTDFNRGWLEARYGKEIVRDVEQKLAEFQKAEKQAIGAYFEKQFEKKGFGSRSSNLSKLLFESSGLAQSYSAMTDNSLPVEVTEGQKKMYCMAQAKENLMFEQLNTFISECSPLTPDAQVETKIRGLDFVKPALFVCTPGVWLIVSKNPTKDKAIKYVLNDSWKSLIDLTDRDVVMTWDADAAYNPEVANAAQWTGWAMRREFPGSVPRWRLYDEEVTIEKPDGTPVKLGADDLITHFGPAAFFDLPACNIATGIPRSQMIDEANKLSESSGKKVNYIGYLEQKFQTTQGVSPAGQDTFGF